MIEYRTGDLFDATDLDAIGHGCNCVGLMGAGIALAFRVRYPLMYAKYNVACERDAYGIGDIMVYETNSKPAYIYNLFTQYMIGADAKMTAVAVSVARMLVDAEDRGLNKIGIPRIGCGIGGLKWPNVNDTISEIYDSFKPPLNVQLIVFSL